MASFKKYICVAVDPITNTGESSDTIVASGKEEALKRFKAIYPNMEIRAVVEVGKC